MFAGVGRYSLSTFAANNNSHSLTHSLNPIMAAESPFESYILRDIIEKSWQWPQRGGGGGWLVLDNKHWPQISMFV